MTVTGTRSGRSVLAIHSHVDRACLASSAFFQHFTDTRHIFR